eukprot:15117161-Alexandrium_andersonii.AAC.1
MASWDSGGEEASRRFWDGVAWAARTYLANRPPGSARPLAKMGPPIAQTWSSQTRAALHPYGKPKAVPPPPKAKGVLVRPPKAKGVLVRPPKAKEALVCPPKSEAIANHPLENQEVGPKLPLP